MTPSELMESSTQCDVSSLLASGQSLWEELHTDSPANSRAAQLHKDSQQEYEERVPATAEQSWNDSEHTNEFAFSIIFMYNIPPVEKLAFFNCHRFKDSTQKKKVLSRT